MFVARVCSWSSSAISCARSTSSYVCPGMYKAGRCSNGPLRNGGLWGELVAGGDGSCSGDCSDARGGRSVGKNMTKKDARKVDFKRSNRQFVGGFGDEGQRQDGKIVYKNAALPS